MAGSNLKFICMLPNIWIGFYNNINKETTDYNKKRIQQFCNCHSISELIRIDKDTQYWKKSDKFINDIKKNMINHEISILTQYFIKISNKINKNYKNNKNTLILSNSNLEIITGLFIIFNQKYSALQYQKSIDVIQLLLGTQISLSENMKQLIRLYNLNL
tara:strand:+ start:1939 stop:2418 length:480 start_codon:yes stop_codon:yes gene_type:complete